MQEDNQTKILHCNEEFIKIRILATLLRDYGVKHIVLSPGGRNVPLVRIFEYNADSFFLHNVVDERSAGYFGLGIAAQLRQPVACVCTSGTAVSNYLPAVTEAFFTGIPLIMITADRLSVYHGQGEDQTIPQHGIYGKVVKKYITLPEGSGYRVEHQTRRDISDCILETTHNGFGPVHINLAIDNISIGMCAPREAWKLLPKIYPHILRVGLNDSEQRLMEWVMSLRNSERILIVYGQNPQPGKEHKAYIEQFLSKYNCVLVADHIANMTCKYSVKPYSELVAISQNEFDENLSPDIVITVGGKRLMNDPLTDKIRHGHRNIRHWSIVADGKIKDFYFRLSSVIEMTQDKFFEWFASHAGDIANNEHYYRKWKKLCDGFKPPMIDYFDALYIQQRLFAELPAKCILHLGIGQSFIESRRFHIDESVDVYCNMGTNGIDGSVSTFMGQCAVSKEKVCFLLVGDLSFFYDMNALWYKSLNSNMRILMVNNNGSGLLRWNNLDNITAAHGSSAKGWVESTGFKYMTAANIWEFEDILKDFVRIDYDAPLFFEVFC